MDDADRLYREHAPSLIRYLQRQLGDRDLAEDVTQETFLRALRHEPRTNARSWLFTTATNLVRDLARRDVRRRVHLKRLQRDHVHDLQSTVFDDAVSAHTLNGSAGDGVADSQGELPIDSPMHRALQSLSERDRTALLLSEEGLSYNEIAVMLELSMLSVGTTLTRARKRLIREYEALVGTVAVQGDANAK